MSLAEDIANDYLIFDGIETVSLKQYANDALVTTTSVPGALRRALSKRDIQLLGSGLGVEAEDLVFHLPNVNVDSKVPRPGDTITDAASVVYRVVAVDKQTLGTRWRCISRRQEGQAFS